MSILTNYEMPIQENNFYKKTQTDRHCKKRQYNYFYGILFHLRPLKKYLADKGGLILLFLLY